RIAAAKYGGVEEISLSFTKEIAKCALDIYGVEHSTLPSSMNSHSAALMTMRDSAARHYGACPRRPMTDSQQPSHAINGRHGACPRGATIASLAISRRPAGTSPAAAAVV